MRLFKIAPSKKYVFKIAFSKIMNLLAILHQALQKNKKNQLN